LYFQSIKPLSLKSEKNQTKQRDEKLTLGEATGRKYGDQQLSGQKQSFLIGNANQ